MSPTWPALRGGGALRLASWLLPVAAAVAVKWHFAAASPAELRWLLAPAAALTTLSTGVGFAFESGVGYVSTAARYAIIPACSGLNFFVVAFGALSWILAARASGKLSGLAATWGASAALALALTWVANATRLSLCVAMHVRGSRLPWLSAEDSHRLVGMFVYLSALFLAARLASRSASPAGEASGSGAQVALGIAACWYLGFTLGLPLVNGAGRRADFGAHALWVLAATGAFLAVAMGRLVSRRQSVQEHPTGHRR